MHTNRKIFETSNPQPDMQSLKTSKIVGRPQSLEVYKSIIIIIIIINVLYSSLLAVLFVIRMKSSLSLSVCLSVN